MARILYFDPRKLGGHRVEYLHHFYEAASADTLNHYIIITGKNFYDVNMDFRWQPSTHIEIILADDRYIDDKTKPLRKMVWHRCIYLRRIIEEYNIDRVFLVNMVNQMPLLPFFIHGNVKIKGIVYKIPYYLSKPNFLRKMKDYLIYYLYAKCKQIENVYLLNSNEAVSYYNIHFNTRKFKFLPDPFSSNADYTSLDIRELYHISEDKVIFAQFGYLTESKGTCEILKCFSELSLEYKNKIVLILAGDVETSMQEKFKELLAKAINSGATIYTEQRFVSFDYVYSLCACCDFILLPYKDTAKSSGMFGYASYFGVPLVTPSNGLIGEIVDRYHLGYCLDDVSAEGLQNFICKCFSLKLYVSDEYVKEHTLVKFQDEIIKWN